MTLSAITLLYLPSFTYFPNTINKYCPKPVKPRTVLHHSSGTGLGGHVPHIRDRSLRQHFAEVMLPCSFPCPFPLTTTAANVVGNVPAPFPPPHCSMFVWRPLLTLWATFPPTSVQHSPSTLSVGSCLHQQNNLFRLQSPQGASLCKSLHSLYRHCGCVSQTHSVQKMYEGV